MYKIVRAFHVEVMQWLVVRKNLHREMKPTHVRKNTELLQKMGKIVQEFPRRTILFYLITQ